MAGCELGGFLSRCRAEATAICQYCGRDFCDDHGTTLDDGQEICERSRCQEKRVDVEQQAVYKGQVAARNEANRCGDHGCEAGMEGQCTKCKGLFCSRHLEVREIEEGRGLSTVRVKATLCPRCRSRLRLWSRR